MANTPFKMKGFSGFGNSPVKQDEMKMMKKEGKIKQTVTLPHPKHPVTPPSEEQTKTSEGTVEGVTQFDYDTKPVQNVISKSVKALKSAYVDPIVTTGKKIKKYFTEK